MTAKEYLKQYEELYKRAQRYKAEYVNELDQIDAIGSTLSNDAGIPHGTGISKRTEDIAIRLADKALEYQNVALQAIEKRQEVFETIADIKGSEGEILYERYINLHKWEEVCVLVHLSWKQTHRIHARALEAVSNLINDIE